MEEDTLKFPDTPDTYVAKSETTVKKNSGKTICRLAKIAMIVGIVLSLWLALDPALYIFENLYPYYFAENAATLIGIATYIIIFSASSFAVLIGSLLFYGFGEKLQFMTEISAYLDTISKKN